MVRRLSILLFGTLVFVYADTISFRNGTKRTGDWLGADAETIRFAVNGQEHVWSKADVSGVTFGSEPPSSVVPTPPSGPGPASPASSHLAHQQPPESHEPDLLGIIYYRDESGSLKPLETKAAVQKANHTPTRRPSATTYYSEIDGAKSLTRFRTGQKMLFVVRLANGVDPSKFKLYPMESKKNSRRTVFDPNRSGFPITLRVNITSVGGSSYGLTPVQDLEVGEYAISPDGSTDAFCFGVD